MVRQLVRYKSDLESYLGRTTSCGNTCDLEIKFVCEPVCDLGGGKI